MCFIVTSKSKKAKTDIVCWKVLNRGNEACYADFFYEKGKINPIIRLKKDMDNEIFEGYHSYQSKERAYFAFEYWGGTFVKKFIIPAGIRYYQNDWFGEYVSETIILAQR